MQLQFVINELPTGEDVFLGHLEHVSLAKLGE